MEMDLGTVGFLLVAIIYRKNGPPLTVKEMRKMGRGYMPDQTRNLNPTPEARVAMIIWGKEYSEQNGGSMDFWDRLSESRKRRCKLVVETLSSIERRK